MANQDETEELGAALARIEKPQRSACVLVVAGAQSGRIYRLGNDALIGRGLDVSICLEDDGISRYHARLERVADGSFVIHDCDSRNGIFCNGKPVKSCALADGDLIGIGKQTVLQFAYKDASEEQLLRNQYDYATRDALTGAFNRRYFDDNLAREFRYAQRTRKPLALVLMDLDRFKLLNDTYGHPAGDAALRHVATLLSGLARKSEILARWGGEEFAALLRDTPEVAARATAERWRQQLDATPCMTAQGPVQLTASFGVVCSSGDIATAAELVAAADRNLYQAKAGGRNRVVG